MKKFKYAFILTTALSSTINISKAIELDTLGAGYSTAVRSNLQGKEPTDLLEYTDLNPAEKFVRLPIEMILESLRLQEMAKTAPNSVSAETALSAGQGMFASLISGKPYGVIEEVSGEEVFDDEKNTIISHTTAETIEEQSKAFAKIDHYYFDGESSNIEKETTSNKDTTSLKYSEFTINGKINPNVIYPIGYFMDAVASNPKEKLYYDPKNPSLDSLNLVVGYYPKGEAYTYYDNMIVCYVLVPEALKYKDANPQEQLKFMKTQGLVIPTFVARQVMMFKPIYFKSAIQVAIENANKNNQSTESLKDLLDKVEKKQLEKLDRKEFLRQKELGRGKDKNGEIIKPKIQKIDEWGYVVEGLEDDEKPEYLDYKYLNIYPRTLKTGDGTLYSNPYLIDGGTKETPQGIALTSNNHYTHFVYTTTSFIPKTHNTHDTPNNILTLLENSKNADTDVVLAPTEKGVASTFSNISLARAFGWVDGVNADKQNLQNNDYYTILKHIYVCKATIDNNGDWVQDNNWELAQVRILNDIKDIKTTWDVYDNKLTNAVRYRTEKEHKEGLKGEGEMSKKFFTGIDTIK